MDKKCSYEMKKEERNRQFDDTDMLIQACAYEAHEKVESMYCMGWTEMYKDEHFIQFILYQVFCEKFHINTLEKKGRVLLEFPSVLLQPFKPAGLPGKPRALDFAISPKNPLLEDDVIPIAIEMKLTTNCYSAAKMAAIQSDLIRLSFLRQRNMVYGPCARKCYFIMFGLKEELDGLFLPGFKKNFHEEGAVKYQDVPSCWSLPITKFCDKGMVKSVFLDPKREGESKGYDLVDEICIRLVGDTTIMPKAFQTGVKVWVVYMPDPDNGFITG